MAEDSITGVGKGSIDISEQMDAFLENKSKELFERAKKSLNWYLYSYSNTRNIWMEANCSQKDVDQQEVERLIKDLDNKV